MNGGVPTTQGMQVLVHNWNKETHFRRCIRGGGRFIGGLLGILMRFLAYQVLYNLY